MSVLPRQFSEDIFEGALFRLHGKQDGFLLNYFVRNLFTQVNAFFSIDVEYIRAVGFSCKLNFSYSSASSQLARESIPVKIIFYFECDNALTARTVLKLFG